MTLHFQVLIRKSNEARISPPAPLGGPSPKPHSMLGRFTPRRVTAQPAVVWMEVPAAVKAGIGAPKAAGKAMNSSSADKALSRRNGRRWRR